MRVAVFSCCDLQGAYVSPFDPEGAKRVRSIALEVDENVLRDLVVLLGESIGTGIAKQIEENEKSSREQENKS